MALLCQCCSVQKHNQYCSDCIQEGVTSHLQFAQTLRTQRSTAINHSSALLSQSRRGASAWRKLRAEVAAKEREVQQLNTRLTARSCVLEELISANRDLYMTRHLESRSTSLVSQRRVLNQVNARITDVGKRILHARRVLVQEAIAIFGVQQDITQVWSIAGLLLPGPEGMKSLPSTEINATLVHLIHLVTLVTRYLSITLPFTPSFPKMVHVGRPMIRANLPFLNTTKYRDKVVLWMSSTVTKRDLRSTQKHRQFLTAFGLFAHSIAYLAWSQGVDGIGIVMEERVPEIKISATAVLQLLAEMSRSPKLGERAHEPGTALLSHLGFSLDVNNVVEAVLRHEEDGEQGWDIVDASSI